MGPEDKVVGFLVAHLLLGYKQSLLVPYSALSNILYGTRRQGSWLHGYSSVTAVQAVPSGTLHGLVKHSCMGPEDKVVGYMVTHLLLGYKQSLLVPYLALSNILCGTRRQGSWLLGYSSVTVKAFPVLCLAKHLGPEDVVGFLVTHAVAVQALSSGIPY
jgi:hypothetical protein